MPAPDFEDSGDFDPPKPPHNLTPVERHTFDMQAWHTRAVIAEQKSGTRKMVAQLRDNANDAKERHSEAREWNAGIMRKLNAPGPLGRIANRVADDVTVTRALIALICAGLAAGTIYFGVLAKDTATQPAVAASP